MRFWDGTVWTPQTFVVEKPARPVGYRFAMLGQGIRAGLILSLLIGLGEIALYIWGLTMFDDAIAAGDIDRLSTFDDLNSALSISEVVVFLVTGIVWVIWQYQLAASAAAGVLDRNPGWHLGSWFIPLANLVMPFQNVRDLWRNFTDRPGSALVGWWWAATLLSGLVLRVGAPNEDEAGLGPLQTEVSWWLVSAVIGLASASLALVIVHRLTIGGLARSAVGVRSGSS